MQNAGLGVRCMKAVSPAIEVWAVETAFVDLPVIDPATMEYRRELLHTMSVGGVVYGLYLWWYRLEEELAIGGCGTVFYGVHNVAGKEVAIKLEPVVEKQQSPLQHESRIFKTLMGGPGVPWMIWSGKQGDYNVMVIDLPLA
ncbi:hypothetical protein BC826DRAFT_1110736 [Russula brevipes]|nr:hypothetical protein BC826DRAFT_1110736 [Russula brevipes]